ncbi:Putative aminoacrylate peracid reductase RutC [Pseudomonas fluorescens]|jgi:enamine deaminase RidA (YjgF/YER057c/UK114 family)|nr:Putative aminoacrylate peracid reductase RutC [Pseudomonas fluorescens]
MTLPLKRQLVHTRSQHNPAPIWQSEAVRAGSFIFTSAKLATDWVNSIAPQAQVDAQFPNFCCPSERQTEYILRSLAETLEQAGSSLSRVVKAHVFLLDSAQFPGFDRVWKRYFPQPPTRTTVGADGLLIPGALLEISLIAVAVDSDITVQPAKSDAPRPLTKKVEAIRAGDFVFTSGQLAHDAVAGVPAEAAGEAHQVDLAKQTTYTLNNMVRSLAAAGAQPTDVIKAQALLLDTRGQDQFLPAWRDAALGTPSLAVTGIGSLLVSGTIIEIDLTAYTGADLRLPVHSSPHGPEAVGCGELVFSAGIYPGFDTGELPTECIVHEAYPYYSSAITLQTEWVLRRLDAALREVASDLAHVAKAQIFLTDLSDFALFDSVWRKHFQTPPARSVVKASPLPVEGARIAIEVIALTA